MASGALEGLLPGGEPPLCEVGGPISECGRVTGIVVRVDGASLAVVDGFSLRTDRGEVIDFIVERLDVTGGGKPGPHLREHRLDGLAIDVEYKVDAGRRVALRYTDAH